jgi:DNA-binding response OmpR family regulator
MTESAIANQTTERPVPDFCRCPTALVVDDDPTVRESLEILLEHYGFQVAVARNGRQGMAAFGNIAPDVILTDIMMPEQDGIETIAAMRKARPDVKIVAMSGAGPVGKANYLRMAVKLGADRGVPKPLSARELLSVLRTILPPEPGLLAPAAIAC